MACDQCNQWFHVKWQGLLDLAKRHFLNGIFQHTTCKGNGKGSGRDRGKGRCKRRGKKPK